jgi:chemosensory pili system protein ChpA (sensor histidine kinase/response regulator)
MSEAPANAADDVSALAWVLDELRRSLEAAHKALRRHLKEAASLRGSDVDAVDPAVLRNARVQLHQGVGALELVDLGAAAQVLRASEAAVQRFSVKPALLNAAAAEAIEAASFALLDYLGRLLAGKRMSPVALFPQYRAVQELAGADRIHPADLWPHDWQWRSLPVDGSALPRPADERSRSSFEAEVLALMRSPDRATLVRLCELCGGLAAGAQSEPREATLWQLAAAAFEAQGAQALRVDLYAKRLASRLLAQLRARTRGGHAAEASERLARDLLFFCAQARSDATSATPRLVAVREAYGLTSSQPVDYELARLGRFDPALVTQARKRIAAAKEAWSAVAAGEPVRSGGLGETFTLVGESLQRLFANGEPLATALTEAAQSHLSTAPGAELAMEVATALMYVEAALEEGDFDAPELPQRMQRLSQRVGVVLQGQAAQPLEAWMEELYRRVSDKQTMGSVVQELRASLSEIEKQVDQFFREPSQRDLLVPVPAQLSSMRGVLSVLGMGQASIAALHLRDDVDALMQTEVDAELAAGAGTFERLADNLGALSFFIDMVAVQPALAKSLFRFDAVSGGLRATMGHAERSSAFGALDAAEDSADDAALLVQARQLAHDAASSAVPDAQLAQGLDALVQAATVADRPELAQTLSAAQAALSEESDAPAREALRAQLAQAIAPAAAAQPASEPLPAAAVPAAPPSSQAFDDDAEMRDVFLDEAAEVIEGAREALAAAQVQSSDLAALTTLRRAFHTLKGSSRMVGLATYGEAAWACEQLYNQLLAQPQPALDEVRAGFTDQALGHLQAWAEAVRLSGGAPADEAERLAALAPIAEHLRLHGRLPPAGAAATPAAEPPSWTSVADPVPAPDVMDDPEPTEVLPLAPAAADAAATPQPLPSLLDRIPDLPSADLLTLDLPAEPEALDLSLNFPAELAQPAAYEAAAVPTELPPGGDVVEFELDLGGDAPPPLPPLASADAMAPAQEAIGSPFGTSSGLVPEPLAPPISESISESIYEAMPEAIPEAVPETISEFTAEPVSEPIFEPLLEPLLEPTAELPEPPAVPPLPATEPDAAWPDLADVGDVVGADAQALAQEAVLPPVEPAAEPDLLEGTELAESVRQIGPLRIGIPLFNIYLNEADELSRRLGTEIAQWSLNEAQPLPADAVVLAHSLAGSSGTVGFAGLQTLARALEHALMRADEVSREPAGEAELFGSATEAVRAMLHHFAAGFLPELDEALVARLNAYLPQALVESSLPGHWPEAMLSAEREMAFAALPDLALEPEPQPAPAAEAEPALAPAVATTVERHPPTEPDAGAPVEPEPAAAAFAPEPAAEPAPEPAPEAAVMRTAPLLPSALDVVGFAPLLAPSATQALHTGAAKDAFDDAEDIDVQDDIDAELFPIFEEEAAELLPQLLARLRDWHKRPLEADAAAACMRTLHTFKGGARLAGAMRVGELAHRLETAIEHLAARADVSAREVEPLLARADALQAGFEALRSQPVDAAAAAVSQQGTPGANEALPSQPPSVPAVPQVSATEAGTAPGQAPPAAAAEWPADGGAPGQAVPADAVPAAPAQPPRIDWARFLASRPAVAGVAQPADKGSAAPQSTAAVRVRAPLLDRLVNQAGEVSIARSRIEGDVGQLKSALGDLTENLERLRRQLRDIEVQAESQISSRLEAAKANEAAFDPLELDRFTRFQELTRMMAESVNDVATVQRSLQRTLQSTEDELAAQARLTRSLQDDLLRTRMVEFEGLSERLYRVVRQAGRETGKQVRLDIVGGATEIDRGVLDRMVGPFEHLLRNSVVHGIESPEARGAAGKDASGQITVSLAQQGNEVAIEFRDDGAGLNLPRIRERAVAQGLLRPDEAASDEQLAGMIFAPGFSTASAVTELAGRGVGMDVVRAEVAAMGGRIETASQPGQGASFRLLLPLTTAVTQVVMLRAGELSVALPATLVEAVRRVPAEQVERAYASGRFELEGAEPLPFFWLGALLDHTARGSLAARSLPVLIVRSASQRVAVHVDDVPGNQEVVVKNIGQQMARLPGLVGVTLLPSGAIAPIYNPVALATLFGARAQAQAVLQGGQAQADAEADVALAPLVLVVDDSLTVRRVTQRLLQREGYRVITAKDGMDGLEKLAQERPAVVLSDIEMPRMDGFDFVRNLRADPQWQSLPVVMITSRIAQKHRDHAAQLGVNHYLGKPYADDELLGLVARYARAG